MRTVVRPLGWMPICEKRFMFEMTASFTLKPDAPGIPQFDLPHKLQAQHRAMFPDGQHIGEAAGAALAVWARGGEPAKTVAPAVGPADDLREAGNKAAARGRDALNAFWKPLTQDQRRAVGGSEQARRWGETATAADQARVAA